MNKKSGVTVGFPGLPTGIPHFGVEDNVKCIAGKHNGRTVEILEVDVLHNPVLYTCRLWFNDKRVALYDNELQSIRGFDQQMLDDWKRIEEADSDS